MRTIITEFKRMFFEKKLIWFVVITVIYVTICCTFWNLRFKLDYDYVEVHYKQSAFFLWQATMNKSFMTVLMKIVPCVVFVFSFLDDRKNGVDNQICIRSHSNIYYTVKYITVIISGMLYNFLSVMLIYVPLCFLLSTGNDGWNYLDRANTIVGKFFAGNTAMEFVLVIAVCYAFIGGVCSAMSYVLSMWIDNRVLICILPYIIFQMLRDILNRQNSTELIRIIIGYVDVCMSDQPFSYSVWYFLWWILLLSILFIISYTIKIKKKR